MSLHDRIISIFACSCVSPSTVVLFIRRIPSPGLSPHRAATLFGCTWKYYKWLINVSCIDSCSMTISHFDLALLCNSTMFFYHYLYMLLAENMYVALTLQSRRVSNSDKTIFFLWRQCSLWSQAMNILQEDGCLLHFTFYYTRTFNMKRLTQTW